MVDREKLAQRLMATYLAELQEHVGSLNRNLLTMEDGPSDDDRPELFNLLFRAAHSLKGASRAVNVELVESVCHRMEDVLGAARDGKLDLMPDHYVVLFKAVDGIEDAGNRLQESRDLTDSPLHALLPDLSAAAAGELGGASADATASEAPTPAATPPAAAKPATQPPATQPPATPPAETPPPKTPPPKTPPSEVAETPQVASEQAKKQPVAGNGKSVAEPETPQDISSPAGGANVESSQESESSTAQTGRPPAEKSPKKKGAAAPAKKAAKNAAKRTVKRVAKKASKKKKSPPQEAPARVTQESKTPAPVATQPASHAAPSASGPSASAPSASAPSASAGPARVAPPASVRVAAEKLDALLAQSGELLVARRRVQSRVTDIDDLRQTVTECRNEWRATAKPLEGLSAKGNQASALDVERLLETVNLNREALTRLERGLERVGTQLSRDGGLLDQACTALEDEVHRVRMLPFAEACGGLDRAVRDVARSTGKQVKLEIGGRDVELDRAVLEGLKDPLMHLVRNGVDHGIETPQERTAAGKPARAQLTVSASLHGAQVQIVVEDDGRGFDIERIREKARSRGLPVPEDDQALARLVFMAGFSTASIVTDISGRGVGLDVVQAQIESLQGSVDLSFTAGQGSRFTLKLPLTLTTTRAIMVRAGGQTYAIPTVNVQQIVRVAPQEFSTVGQRHVLTLGGPPIPVARLTDTLGMDHAQDETDESKLLVVIMGSGQLSAAAIVDELLAEQEITIKNLGRRIRQVRHISGGTLLPSGETALVLNVANVMRSQFSNEVAAPIVLRETSHKTDTPRRLLVVDDSVTTRALMQAILESAGFNVQTAADGRFALEKLDQGKFDLVVSDVDMPRLNGFGLTEAIRKSDRLARTPIILVTARGTDEDKARGIQAGADGYIVKADFEGNNLVETIQQLL